MKRLALDEALDDDLATPDGRCRFWERLQNPGNLSAMLALLESTLKLPGAVIECGVYRGFSLFKICRKISSGSARKMVYACDSFEGFPPGKIARIDQTFLRPARKIRKKFQLAGDVPGRIRRFSRDFDLPIQVVAGYFEETLFKIPESGFCFIHLDVDIYESYKECLEVLYPKLVDGGVVVFDDYGSPKWPGAKKAVDEYFSGRTESVARYIVGENVAWHVRKPHASGIKQDK